jgi:type I restriction-modification system DNA methylase subunit
VSSNSSGLASTTGSAVDLLGEDFSQSDYGRVALPFTQLLRMDCVLNAKKAVVLAEVEAWRNQGIDLKNFLTKRATHSFLQRLLFDFTKLQGKHRTALTSSAVT